MHFSVGIYCKKWEDAITSTNDAEFTLISSYARIKYIITTQNK